MSNVGQVPLRTQNPRKQGASASSLTFWFGMLALGYLPLLIRFGREQWARPEYQFFPLLILAAIYIAWERLRELTAPRVIPGSIRTTHTTIGVALSLLLAAAIFWSGRVAAASFLLVLIALFWHMGGRYVLRALIPSILLLVLIIGPPLGLEEPFLQRLRELAVWASSSLLVWLSVPHLISGTVIEIPGSRLLVAEACSGINSMMAVLGFTLVLVFWRRRSLQVTLILLVLSVIFVLWANTIRIAGGVWLKSTYGVDLLGGNAHELASVILFAICMGLVVSADEGISLLHRWRKRGKRAAANPAKSQQVSPNPIWQISLTPNLWLLAAAFALLGVIQVVNASARGGLAAWLAEPGASHLPLQATLSAPNEVGPWQRSADVEKLIFQPEIEGLRSQAWAYKQGSTTVIIAIDYPFHGYHDLTLCYRNAGWSIQAVEAKTLTQASAPSGYMQAKVGRLNEHGFVLFTSINEAGEWVEAPKESLVARVQDRLKHIGRPDWQSTTYQIQAWVQSFEPLTEAQQSQVQQLFLAARSDLARQVLSQLEGVR